MITAGRRCWRPAVFISRLVSPNRSPRRIKSGLEGDFAGLEHFEGAEPIGVSWELQQDGVTPGGKFQGGGSVAVEFVIDEDFCAIGFRGKDHRAEPFRNRRGSRGGR